MPGGDFPFGYERIAGLAVTAELVLLAFEDHGFKVVMAERHQPPFEGKLVLPGAFMREDEDLESTAIALKEHLGLVNARLEEIGTFSSPGRDPRGRYVASAYFAAVDIDQLLAPVMIDEDLSLVDVAAGADGELVLTLDGATAEPGFDHADIIAAAMRHLRRTREDSLTRFRFLPHYFTLLELQRVHEAMRGQTLDKPLFRKQVLARIFEDGSRLKPSPHERPGKGRPATLYERVRSKEESEAQITRPPRRS